MKVEVDVLLNLIICCLMFFFHTTTFIFLKMFPKIVELKYLLATRAKDFYDFKNFFHFVVDMLWLIFSLAGGLRALPHHLRVYTPLAEKTVALTALHARWCIFVVHWCDKVVTKPTHEEVEADVHFRASADLVLLGC